MGNLISNMYQKMKRSEMPCVFMAALSVLLAEGISILEKCGIKRTDSDVATALRAVVILGFAWMMALIAGSRGTIMAISAKFMLFLSLYSA